MRFARFALLAGLLVTAPGVWAQDGSGGSAAGQNGKDGTDGAGPHGGKGGAAGAASPLASMGTAFLPIVAGPLRIENGSAKPEPGGASAGKGFVTIRNSGDAPDRIVSVSSPSSRETRTYRKIEGADPERVEGLEIPAHGTVAMRADGTYIDFRNVIRPFETGGEVAVTLTFEKAGAVGLRLPVVAPR